MTEPLVVTIANDPEPTPEHLVVLAWVVIKKDVHAVVAPVEGGRVTVEPADLLIALPVAGTPE